MLVTWPPGIDSRFCICRSIVLVISCNLDGFRAISIIWGIEWGKCLDRGCFENSHLPQDLGVVQHLPYLRVALHNLKRWVTTRICHLCILGLEKTFLKIPPASAGWTPASVWSHRGYSSSSGSPGCQAPGRADSTSKMRPILCSNHTKVRVNRAKV